MPWSRPKSFRRSSRSSLDAVASTVAPARFASWIAAMPTPPAPAWISTVSPACRWPNSKRQSSAVPNATGTHATATDVGAVGDRPGEDRRDRGELGVRAPEVRRDDPLADVTIGHALADLADRARALVADDVGHGRHLAAGAVERVAALDADRLDLDEHAAVVTDGIGDVFVAEHVGRTGLVVHGSFHGRMLRRGILQRRLPRLGRRAGHFEDLADRALVQRRLGQRKVALDDVAVAPAVTFLEHVAGRARSLTIAYALRSVISSAAAMSRSRTPGSRAMHSSARPCFVRKLQFAMYPNSSIFFRVLFR